MLEYCSMNGDAFEIHLNLKVPADRQLSTTESEQSMQIF